MTNADPHARIDPASRPALEQFLAALPGGLQALPIPQRRETLTAMLQQAAAAMPAPEGVQTEDRTIPGPDGAPEVPVRIYRAAAAEGARPGVLYIHGGGMVVGGLDSGDYECKVLCAQLGAVVVNVDYRLAPEHPHPAPVEDCYASLQWFAAQAEALGVDDDRIAIYGPSAGGGLTVATTLVALDRKGPKIRFVMALYPMLDDRNVTPSSHQITSIGVWDRHANLEAWQAYLGGGEADHYAAPARREDVTGFPPAFIDVGTEDAFRDEDIAFANKLLAAGVATELHVLPGAYHGSELMAPTAPLSQRILTRRFEALAEHLS